MDKDKDSNKYKMICQLYNELNKFSKNAEYEKALKTANRILGVAPSEKKAFHCKIVCFIHLNKFDEAINLFNKKPEETESLAYEKAYCYYRTNQNRIALKILQDLQNERRTSGDTSDDTHILELLAQVSYRSEECTRSAELYQEIIKRSDDDYEDERLANLLASLAMSDKDVNLDNYKETTYEHIFNKACYIISRQLYAEAEKKLKLCEKRYKEQLIEDELTEEEFNKEMALVKVQLAYVYQRQGRSKEAEQIYTESLKLKLDETALLAVASNNACCINKDQNLFDSKKKMKFCLHDNVLGRFNEKSKRIISLNNAILTYHLNQLEACSTLANALDQTSPELQLNGVILRASCLHKSGKIDEAINVLKNFKTNDPNHKLYVNLAIAQYYLIQGDKINCCLIMENLDEFSYKPAIVAALITLYMDVGEEAKALKVFEKAVDWFKKSKVQTDLSNMWRQAAEFHLKHGHAEVAVNSLEELLRSNSKDKKTLAQLVLALIEFNPQKALIVAKDLPQIKELADGLDIELLESTSLAVLSAKKATTTKGDSQPSTPRVKSSEKSKKNKKKKGKLPKNANLSIPPDPERWLPKYERSGYRKKRDRRVKEVIKGSQGTASGQSDQYDFSGRQVDTDSQETPEPSPRVLLKKQHQKFIF